MKLLNIFGIVIVIAKIKNNHLMNWYQCKILQINIDTKKWENNQIELKKRKKKKRRKSNKNNRQNNKIVFNLLILKN